jgi:mevalonate pyrophosphate decarboxylase
VNALKEKSVAVAYPTIPIIFLGGITEDRRPLYNTIGLAVTDQQEKVRVETSVKVLQDDYDINFLIDGKPIAGKRGNDLLNAVKEFLKNYGANVGLDIESRNQGIISGSSDAGAAALSRALSDVSEANYPIEEVARYAMKCSESAIRSVYGGMSKIVVDQDSEVSGVKLVSEDELNKYIGIYSIQFNYPSRISADDIHSSIVSHPWFKYRVERIPEWTKNIEQALERRDFVTVFKNAEENIRNAHYLLEDVGVRVRKKEMMNCCLDVEDMRRNGIETYYLVGGGNMVSIAFLNKQENLVFSELKKKGYNPIRYKVASGAKVI